MFMELIQAHERSWGMEQYPGRPTLAELLHRPVVVFWVDLDKTKTSKGRYIVTVHNTVDELNPILLDMILAGKVTPSAMRRLSRIYIKQKAVKITQLQLILSEADKSGR
jgi:hypothetical protein